MLWSLKRRVVELPTGASHDHLSTCDDLGARFGERNAELGYDKGDAYALAATVEADGSWLCLLGPPTAREPALDPEGALHHRRIRLRSLIQRVQQKRGLDALDLGDVACLAIRWDARRCELSARRDLFGRVPLFYGRNPFSAPTSALLSTRPAALTDWRPPEILPPLWQDFLKGRDSEVREDFWPGVDRFFPGEERRWRAGRWESVRRPWAQLARKSAEHRHTRATEPDMAEHLLQRLAYALNRQRVEPRPVFAMSGGIDSTTLVALSLERERSVRTASMVSSRHPAFDERPRIQALIEHLHTEHRFVDIGAPELWSPRSANPGLPDLGPQLLWDAPYTRHFLHAMAADASTALFGIGADQLLLSLPVLHLEECARAASLSQLLTLISQRSSQRDRLRLLAAKTRLSPAIRRWRGGLIDRRPLLFEGWKWDLAMRALERHRRESGLRFAFPFLDAELWQLALTLSHRQRRWQTQTKGPLRRALHGRIPEELPQQGHRSIFNEISAEGMRLLFGSDGPWHADLFHSPLPRVIQREEQHQTLAWLHQGAPWKPVAPASTARSWTAMAMWMRWSRHHQPV